MAYTERAGLLADASKPTPVSLTWQNLSYTVDEKISTGFCRSRTEPKVLINNISGYVKPGQLLAIMGSSGAGKSTLLDILAARKDSRNVTGSLLVNGKPHDSTFNRVAGYVTQDDCLAGLLTVEETLQFYANLKLPSSIPTEEKQRKVTRLLNKLGLDKVRNSRVGTQFQRGISGGEKKRLSVGCELITDPSLIFLDEPTTGLDAYNSLCVMDMLNDLCREGRTVVCTIHQPRSNIFDLFDQLLLLSHGSVVYFGPAKEAIGYFAALSFHCRQFLNPADFFLDVIMQNDQTPSPDEPISDYIPTPKRRIASFYESGDEESGSGPSFVKAGADKVVPVDLLVAYRSSSFCEDTGSRIAAIVDESRSIATMPRGGSVYAANWFVQTYVLSVRVIMSTLRNPLATYAQLFQVLFMALLVGSIYLQLGDDQPSIQDRLGALFFMATNQAFGMLGSLNVFLEERNLVNRERAGGAYRTSAYFMAKTFVEAPFFLLFPLIFATIAYWMIGLQPTAANFGIFLGNLVLFAAVSGSMFLAIGAVSPNATVAQIISPVLTVLFLLFGGFYVNADSIPSYYQWLAYLSFFKYGFETMVYNEFHGETFTCPANSTSPCITSGDQELAILGMSNVSIEYNFLILLAMLVFYRLFAYLCLVFLYKEKR